MTARDHFALRVLFTIAEQVAEDPALKDEIIKLRNRFVVDHAPERQA